jgi:hypothetical protein
VSEDIWVTVVVGRATLLYSDSLLVPAVGSKVSCMRVVRH